MTFDNSYFEDEVREGFYIPGMVKRSWATQLEILENVIKICNRHDLKWFAGYGTLLGAVRHHGFIPWDDDLDICMIKDDYDRFVEYAVRELPRKYTVLNIYKRNEYSNFLTRILNHDIIDTRDEFMNENCGFPFASGIDVFPLHYLYPDDEREEIRRQKAHKIWKLIEDNKNLGINDGQRFIREIEEISGLKLRLDIPAENAIYRILDTVFSEAPKEGATHVTLMPIWAERKAQKFPIGLFDNLISVPFENTQILIPAAYNKTLKLIYGNWEIANRKGGLHNYPFYKGQEEEMEKHYGRLPYKYYYGEDSSKESSVKLTNNTIVSILDTLEAACKMISLLYQTKDYDSLISLLENSQELAIKAGTNIEEIYGSDGALCVKKLEEFCEQIFLLNECLIENNDNEYNIANLQTVISQAREFYQILYTSEDIVFITCKSSEWLFLDPIYQKAIKENKKVRVLCVSYFEKDLKGNFSDIEHYDNTGYPDYVDITDYSNYSFAFHHPKEIIYQNPFDQFASAISIHPMFYSYNLKQFADKITYVQSFKISNISDDDEKGLYTSNVFIISPGVINADSVIVPDDNTRDLYINTLTDNTDMSRNILEDKIVSLSLEYPSNTQSVNDVKPKKRLLFYIGFSDLFENTANIINKLNNCIDVFNANKDAIDITWGQDKNLDSLIESYDNTLFDEFKSIRTKLININIDFLETDDWSSALDSFDAFYGSSGYAMNLAVQKGFPVMSWNVNI